MGLLALRYRGGKPPYRYVWNETDSTSNSLSVANLKKGTYLMEVYDSKECRGIAWAELTAPEPIGLNSNSSPPRCKDECNGSVAFSATGGTAPYQYWWNGSALASTIKTNLCAGKHTLTIKDAKNCLHIDSLRLINPSIKLNLPDSAVICRGQKINLDAGMGLSKYYWSSAEGMVSTEQKVSLNKAGLYFLNVVDALGCTESDSFYLKYSDQLLKAYFLRPRQAAVGDTVLLIEYSWPVPETYLGSIHRVSAW